MVRLWFETQFRIENWSIGKHLHELQSAFHRLPRSLTSYSNFKANEMRILLLFGFIIFEGVLGSMYYNNLLQLVLMMHLTEQRKIIPSYVELISRLGKNFTSIL